MRRHSRGLRIMPTFLEAVAVSTRRRPLLQPLEPIGRGVWSRSRERLDTPNPSRWESLSIPRAQPRLGSRLEPDLINPLPKQWHREALAIARRYRLLFVA